MFDVFYIDHKPGLFAHEARCRDIDHAQQLSRTRLFWIVNYLCDYQGFDFVWEPPPWQAHYRHAWASQWQTDSGTYLIPRSGYQDTRYHDSPRIPRTADPRRWHIPAWIDPGSIDFSWHPDPLDPPYIYHFPSQHQNSSGVTYTVPGAREIKITDGIRVSAVSHAKDLWHIPAWIDPGSIDFSWHPDPLEPPMTYHFSTRRGWDRVGGPEYRMPGATEIKYIHDIVAQTRGDPGHWHVPAWIDPNSIDPTWCPDPTEPPYIYEFPVEWGWDHIGGPEYRVPGATQKKYTQDFVARTLPDPINFKVLDNVSSRDPVFRWRPNPADPPYIYVFGNQWWPAEKRASAVYRVSGAIETKYVPEPRCQRLPDSSNYQVLISGAEFDHSWEPDPGDPPYIYVFGNQWHAAEIMPTIRYHVPGATEKKYIDHPRATLQACRDLWFVPENIDITGIDFSWVPDPGEPAYIYQFPTQHQKTAGPEYRVPGATQIKYLEMPLAEVKSDATPIIEIDHLDGNAGQIPNTVRRVRYFDNYRDTLIRLAKSLIGEHEHVWICSSICDYTEFDFSWHPEIWQSTMLHVFASDDQKFGDTFYMHVPTFAERAEKKQLLEWYNVNYVPRRKVPRRLLPIIRHDQDTHVEVVKNSQWSGPLAVFTTDTVDQIPAVSLWRDEVKTITPLSRGASQVIVPRVAVPHIKTQLYDYPHIDKTHKTHHTEHPLDIVFIDNNETNADTNYDHLVGTIRDGSNPNRIHRSTQVLGRVAAYQAAARLSHTPWFFAVFAKLEVDPKFDWAWQPDRMQQLKHYIFHAVNPVNGLVYGHQALIAYNKQLVLNNAGHGLDFTLDSAHEVVPTVSGIARYADTPWMAWRTAFREVLKLKASLPDVESDYRLGKWLENGWGSNGDWSVLGAHDAAEYYDSVSGDFVELRKSYDWAWLTSYALLRRNLTPNQ